MLKEKSKRQASLIPEITLKNGRDTHKRNGNSLHCSQKTTKTCRDFDEDAQMLDQDDNVYETFSQKNGQRSLRPKKIQNYRQLLEGDEITKKTIEDEYNEIRKKREEGDYNDYIALEDDKSSDGNMNDDDWRKKPSFALRKRNTTKKINNDSYDNDEDGKSNGLFKKRSKKLKNKKKSKVEVEEEDDDDDEMNNNIAAIDNLPNDVNLLKQMLKQVKLHMQELEVQFLEEEDSDKEELLKANIPIQQHDEKLTALQQQCHIKQFWCIPLSIDVRQKHLFDKLRDQQMKSAGRLFDVITIDPPWQLSSANPTRGVAIAYETLNDREILNIPFNKIQTDGFLFIWVINAKYRFAIQMMEELGYKLVDEIAWVKQTVNGKIAKGHGYYLQHAKETCLVGVKGNVKGRAKFNIESDVIFSQRRGQSQKPEEIYDIAEALVPNGYYLEIFGRRNNLHNGWVTIGNEI